MLIPNQIKLLQHCIEEGISYGMRRAYKHTDNPQPSQIELEVYQAIIHEIYEWFTIKGELDE